MIDRGKPLLSFVVLIFNLSDISLASFRRLNANYQFPIPIYPKVDNTDARFTPQVPQFDGYHRPPSPPYGGPIQPPVFDSTSKKYQVIRGSYLFLTYFRS